MSSTRCAVCKYFRRRCPSDCIFSPYFPPNNPQRFVCVHRIYGASNIGKMLEQVPVHARGEAIESLVYEAKCRIQDPVYGCVRIISLLHQQIQIAQSQLAKTQADIAFYIANNSIPLAESSSSSSVMPKYSPHSEQPEFDLMPTTTSLNSFMPTDHEQISFDAALLESTYGLFNMPSPN